MVQALSLLSAQSRIHIVDIFLIQAFAKLLHRFAEALEVYNFSGTQELDDIIHIGIVRKSEDVVIGRASLLLCCNCVRTTGPKNSVFMRVFGIGIFG